MFKLVLPTRSSSPSKKREVDDDTINRVAGFASSFYDLKSQLGSILGQINQIENDLDTVMSTMDVTDGYYGNAEALANDISSISNALNSLSL